MSKQPPQTVARKTAQRTVTRRAQPGQHPGSNVSFGFPWTLQNLIGIAAGVVVVIIGYVLMSTAITPAENIANNDGIWNNSNAVTVAPILLVIGYCMIIPYFIFKRFGPKVDESTPQADATV